MGSMVGHNKTVVKRSMLGKNAKTMPVGLKTITLQERVVKWGDRAVSEKGAEGMSVGFARGVWGC